MTAAAGQIDVNHLTIPGQPFIILDNYYIRKETERSHGRRRQ